MKIIFQIRILKWGLLINSIWLFRFFQFPFFFLILIVVISHENKIFHDLNTHKGNASNFTRQIIQQSSNSFFKHSKTHQNNKNIFPNIFNVEYCYEIWETGFIIVENILDIIQENLYDINHGNALTCILLISNLYCKETKNS